MPERRWWRRKLLILCIILRMVYRCATIQRAQKLWIPTFLLNLPPPPHPSEAFWECVRLGFVRHVICQLSASSPFLSWLPLVRPEGKRRGRIRLHPRNSKRVLANLCHLHHNMINWILQIKWLRINSDISHNTAEVVDSEFKWSDGMRRREWPNELAPGDSFEVSVCRIQEQKRPRTGQIQFMNNNIWMRLIFNLPAVATSLSHLFTGLL